MSKRLAIVGVLGCSLGLGCPGLPLDPLGSNDSTTTSDGDASSIGSDASGSSDSSGSTDSSSSTDTSSGTETSDPSSSTDTSETETSSDTGAPCSEVVHSLTIDAQTDPASVACLTTVQHHLKIEGTLLTDLSLLPELQEVGWLDIVNNPKLNGLGGLDKLHSIADRLDLADNPALADLSGLTAIEHLKELALWFGNDSLTTLALPAGVSLPILRLYGWDRPDIEVIADLQSSPPDDALYVDVWASEILDFGGLSDCCSTMLVSLSIDEVQTLETFVGLEGFDVLGDVSLSKVPMLSSLAGIHATEIDTLEIHGDGCEEEPVWQLQDIAGLDPQATINRLTLTEIPSLISLDQLPSTIEVGSAQIYNNPMLAPATAQAWVDAAQPAMSFVCGNGGEEPCWPFEPPGPCPQ